MVGYGLSTATTAIVLPWLFEIFIPLASNLAIGLIFTVVLIARSFALVEARCREVRSTPETGRRAAPGGHVRKGPTGDIRTKRPPLRRPHKFLMRFLVILPKRILLPGCCNTMRLQ